VVVDELVTGVAELELDKATFELTEDEALAWLVETWGISAEVAERTTGETVLERLWDITNPEVDAVNALDREIPVFVNEAWLLGAARDIVLDDAEAASAWLMLGTLEDGTRLRLLLLLSATGLLIIELLLGDIDTVTADDIELELDIMLGDATTMGEVTASCEEATTALLVEGDTISIVLLPRVPIALEAIADWEVTLEMIDIVDEELCGFADDKDVLLATPTGITPTLTPPALTLTT
jgi:hypothetical protein